MQASDFEMYTVYCRNRPKSEILVNDSTENQAFFKGIQCNLAHPLDLNSYLLKPIQRITKYQLLLKVRLRKSIHILWLSHIVLALNVAYKLYVGMFRS